MLTKFTSMDRQELFSNPVTRAEAPDYFDVVMEPMCWLYMDEKLEKNEYINMVEFKVRRTVLPSTIGVDGTDSDTSTWCSTTRCCTIRKIIRFTVLPPESRRMRKSC